MTGFDHRDSGTSEHAWTATLDALPRREASDRPLVVLAAHPDDETLGAGGLVAASAELGAAVTVLVATDGEASHPDSVTHAPTELADIRRREVTAAVARLAPGATLRFLGLPDGCLDRHADELDGALTDCVTGDTRLVAPYRSDAHPDHDACGRAAARVAQAREAELWEYPIWLWHWGAPPDLPAGRVHAVRLDADIRRAKRQAMAEHVSQHTDLSPQPGDEAILPARVLAHFERPVECFVTGPAAGSGAYFDELYAHNPDPWGLDDRFYEQRKRAALLAALPRSRFSRVFEPGCATGALTEALLDRADEVVAWDVADAAVDRVRHRLGPATGLQVVTGRIPTRWASGLFDLIVLSEVGYYCEDLTLLHRRVLECLTHDGVLVACHWRHPAADHPHTAVAVHTALGRDMHRDVHHLEDDFVLDVWSRTGRSVARQDGVL